jgi:Bifunctional DNA primase/polymerase, N-terminal/AAA domain
VNSNNGRPGQETAAVDIASSSSIQPRVDRATDDTGILASAMWVAEHLGPVFPVDHPLVPRCAGAHGPATPCDGTRGKHPCGRWSQLATTDPERIKGMFSGPPRNIGLACGPPSLLIVDEDETGAFNDFAISIGKTIPATFTVQTARGRRFYFSQDGSLGNGEGALRDCKIDVRGRGGMVVAPGSRHATGVAYTPDDPEAAVAEIPPWMADALRSRASLSPAGQADQAHPLIGPSPFTEAAGWDAMHRGPILQDRHKAFVSYAGYMLHRGLPLHEAETLIARRWQDAHQPADDPYPLQQAVADVRDVYQRYATAPRRAETGRGSEASAVAEEVQRLRIREEAARLVRLERASALQLPTPVNLRDFLSVEDDPARYRVEGVWPVGGRVVLAAQYKAGKSTLQNNLIRSLVDGDPFLGVFPVKPFDGRVVLIDDELDQRMLRRWLREQGIRNPDRVCVLSLRGKVGTFDLTDEATRALWVAEIRKVNGTVVVLDCLRPVLDALGLSEDKDAGRFLVGFDALLGESGPVRG